MKNEKAKKIAKKFLALNTFNQAILNTIPYGIDVVDEKGNILFVGKNFKEKFGNEAIGKKCWNLYRDDKTQCLDCPLKNNMEIGRTATMESHGVFNGKIFQISHTPMIYEGKRAVLEIFQDITDRKLAEKKVQSLQMSLRLEKSKLEQVLNVGQEISSILKLNSLVDYIIKKTAEILEVEKCSLMFLDESTNELVIKGASGLDEETMKKARIKIGSEIAGYVAKKGVPLLIQNIEQAGSLSRENRRHYKSKSFLSVPIKVHNRVIGVVNVADKVEENAFLNEIDLKILETIVRQSAVSIENANYFRELEYLSTQDALTKAYNHRYFIQRLDKEIEHAHRYDRPLSLIMIDIDDFKSYNDAFGHLEGDRLLQELSVALRNQLRGVDILCRYAGDEFVIILPETHPEQAHLVAEKLRDTAINLPLKRKITISIGVNSYVKNLKRIDLMRRVDQALYQAKREGKNNVQDLGVP